MTDPQRDEEEDVSIHYEDDIVTLHHGDCLDVLRSLPDASVDSVVTDPPYGLEFMGKDWDAPWKDPAAKFRTGTEADEGFRVTRGSLPDAYRAGAPFQQWCELWTAECLRVLKPGGHLLAFGGTRTWHRLACAVEDAGFEVRDSIAWMYGSGFPKSLDVSKAIDKAAGAESEVVGRYVPPSGKAWNLERDESVPGYSGGLGLRSESMNITAPTTPDAERWQGWGTALKPAFEPVVVARKPLAGTVAANVLEHGTGALNIAACRVGTTGGRTVHTRSAGKDRDRWEGNEWTGEVTDNGGRWPANVLLDDSQAEVLDEQSGETTSRANRVSDERVQVESSSYGIGQGRRDPSNSHTDSGGASRFFPTFRYEAKAPKSERPKVNGTAHPTVKPLDLMRWLVRLVTPPGGTVLEPFAGSGTTVEACVIEGFKCVAIEKTDEYLPLITQRINRQRNPVAYMQAAGDDLGLFELEEDTE